MKTDDIVKWEMPQFPVRESFLGEIRFYKKRIIELQLISSYFQKFLTKDILFEVPAMDYYQVFGGNFYEIEPLINNYEESIKESLFDELLRWSSFERVQIDFSNISGIPYDVGTWSADRRKVFIEKNIICSMNNAQKQMYENMPDPILDCLNLQLKRKVVYLFSEKLAEYLRFAGKHKKLVKEHFFREHKKLVEMLPYLKAPIENGVAPTYMSMKKACIIGYCVGWKNFQTSISYRSYNWTFFMAWYVLEKILQEAEEVFF